MGLVLQLGTSRYEFFTKATVNLHYAQTGSTFVLSGVFEEENALHRKLFRPLSFPEITLSTTDGTLLITGTVTTVRFKTTSEQELTIIEGYSKTGVLGDCQISIDSYPLEYVGLTLTEIATKLCEPFGISVVVENDGGAAGEVIPEVTATTTQTVSAFLTQIASQRNLILTSTAEGNLLITRANTNVPSMATYRQAIPTVSIGLSVNGQRMHSDLTALKQTSIETDNAPEDTIQNSLVGQFRPITKDQSIGNDNTITDAVRNIRASELRNIRLMIKSDRWEWTNGRETGIVMPNNIIDVIAPDIFLPDRTAFFVETVTLEVDAGTEESTLHCVIPEVYNNEEPKIRFV